MIDRQLPAGAVIGNCEPMRDPQMPRDHLTRRDLQANR
jgi:hypothetical protein